MWWLPATREMGLAIGTQAKDYAEPVVDGDLIRVFKDVVHVVVAPLLPGAVRSG
jgi:hypothetical protein